MDKPRIRPHGLGQISEKSYDIVLCFALDFIDFSYLKSSFLFNFITSSNRNVAQNLLLLNSEKFYLEPNLVSVLVGPDRSHFGAGVARDHISDFGSRPV